MLDPTPANTRPTQSPAKPNGKAIINKPVNAMTVDSISAARGDNLRNAWSAGICSPPMVA